MISIQTMAIRPPTTESLLDKKINIQFNSEIEQLLSVKSSLRINILSVSNVESSLFERG